VRELKPKFIRWKSWEGDGLEHLEIYTEQDGSIFAESNVIGERGGTRYGLRYSVICDYNWIVREVQANVAGGANIHLFTDGKGNWSDTEGAVVSSLEGCIDVDIAATPFTNTLPIRRLNLVENESREIKVAYLPLPTLKVEPADQRYTCLEYESRYLYEGLVRQFSGELNVDSDGFILDYPDTFRRL